MNIYTVGKVTQGLANFILKEGKQNQGVAIAYDSRNHSKEFGESTALCFNANGIKTYLFEDLRPTPELSFAVRELGCAAGIVITASHNPSKYNGYKVYWEDGAQITSPKDKEIIDEVKNVENYEEIKTISKEEAIRKGFFHLIGENIDKRYLEEIKKQVIHQDIIQEMGKELKIVYTPLHGTGNILVRRVLTELGLENVWVVPEQEKPDGNFPTVKYPNPEDAKAFELALKLGKEKEADIILATDPDADRLGVYAKDSKTGEYMAFTGNMSAILIAEYLLSQKKQKNELPLNGVIIKSIVSSTMANELAKEYKIEVKEVLTGFKYIGEQIKLFEQNHEHEFLFGYEESYGCLIGTHARDKDAIVAVTILCEAAAFYKKHGLTLWDQMIKIYEKYGYYKEDIVSITLEGISGMEKIKKMMEQFRKNGIRKIGQYQVLKIRDYELGKTFDFTSKEEGKTDLPKSNVLYYELEENAWCCIRPSGTEPKIKFYIGIKGKNLEDATEKIRELKKNIEKMVE